MTWKCRTCRPLNLRVRFVYYSLNHWRHPRRGCRGHIPRIFWLGGTSTGISPPILLRTFGYSRQILVALRSPSLKPFSFGYKTPPIRFSQAGGQSAHKARPPQPWTRVDATALNRQSLVAVQVVQKKTHKTSLYHTDATVQHRIEGISPTCS